jgi:hypothetical protein
MPSSNFRNRQERRRKAVVIVMAVLVLVSMLASTAPAFGHEGLIGDGGPFRIELTSGLPESIDATWGNGEVELHVPAGMEVLVFGVADEPFVMLDADGNMMANEKSPTWAMVKGGGHGGTAGTDAKAEPEWVWVRSGGSLQFHDHRIHFMAATVDPALAAGGVVSSFRLPFMIDGERVDVSGNLVFDPSIDPEAAARLVGSSSAGNPIEAPAGGTTDTVPVNPTGNSAGGDQGSTPVLLIVLGVLAAAIGGGVVYTRTKKS